MKVVKQISTGKIAYRQIPDFESGRGIQNAVILFKDISLADLIEVEMTEEEWESTEKLDLMPVSFNPV